MQGMCKPWKIALTFSLLNFYIPHYGNPAAFITKFTSQFPQEQTKHRVINLLNHLSIFFTLKVNMLMQVLLRFSTANEWRNFTCRYSCTRASVVYHWVSSVSVQLIPFAFKIIAMMGSTIRDNFLHKWEKVIN